MNNQGSDTSDGGKRKRASGGAPNEQEDSIDITPPPSPPPPSFQGEFIKLNGHLKMYNFTIIEIDCLREDLRKQKIETEFFKIEAKKQRNRCMELRDKLEEVTADRNIIKERLEREARIRAGIHITK